MLTSKEPITAYQLACLIETCDRNFHVSEACGSTDVSLWENLGEALEELKERRATGEPTAQASNSLISDLRILAGNFGEVTSQYIRDAADEIERLQAGVRLLENVNAELGTKLQAAFEPPVSRPTFFEYVLSLLDMESSCAFRAYVEQMERAAQPPSALRDVVQSVVEWNTKYPSSRIYGEGDIRRIAKEMDAIFEKAKAALSGPSLPPAPVAPTWTCPNCETADEFTVTHHGPDDLGAVYPVMICRICDTTVGDYRAEQIRAICQNNPSVRLAATKGEG